MLARSQGRRVSSTTSAPYKNGRGPPLSSLFRDVSPGHMKISPLFPCLFDSGVYVRGAPALRAKTTCTKPWHNFLHRL
jgi:hypothetical protein